ncbi:hypothetical protein F0562_026615 [Nyssa sinensis]|uniref:Uncharacterized protein n=1 Tax=Nyssa sinensis TaxID=561372 RepID=A0A5J5B9V4_9ASTE|nr:hypothetical protein F0562_026615 [Nyssa sinensis]
MEETDPAPPPNTAQDPLPETTPAIRPPPNHNSSEKNKRKLSDVDFHDSPYFKMLALVKQIRPHFVEILQTPDFQNCKGAYEVRKKMKLLMDLYKQMHIEGNPTGKFDNMLACQPLSGEMKPEKEHLDGVCGGTQVEHLQPKQVPEKSAGEEDPPCSFTSTGELDDGWARGSYIVGGSVFGWNYITFVNIDPPAYYGITKESHRRKS